MSALNHNLMSPRRRILIVEDHPLMREGIAKWISNDPQLEVCGEAGCSAEGLRAVNCLEPELVLCDITLAGRSGLELLKDLHALNSDLPVIMLSMHDESVYALRAMRAGARGYVMKKSGGAELVAAIKEVLAGGSAFSRHVTSQMMAELAGRRQGHRAPVGILTDREFEVLQLYGQGKASNEIADLLRLSPKTVGTHRLNICQKLRLKSTPELVRYAVHYAETLNKG